MRSAVNKDGTIAFPAGMHILVLSSAKLRFVNYVLNRRSSPLPLKPLCVSKGADPPGKDLEEYRI